MTSWQEKFDWMVDGTDDGIKGRVLFGEPMKKHCSMQVGGPADVFCEPKDEEELCKVLEICKTEGIPFFFLGNGTNLLVNDEGFRGVVICPCAHMAEIRVEGNEIFAQAGAPLMKVAVAARDASLAGLAFARGIPGSVGGAVMMNAGAYGSEIVEVLKSARLLSPQGEIREVPASELNLGYRRSRMMESGEIVLAARMELTPGDKEEIAQKGKELLAQRAARQPLEYPSAGSTFKRPKGYFAGKLIQDSGLSGLQVGGAMVSPKHCGFVINVGGATCEDIVALIRQVRARVYDTFGVVIEPEVRYLSPVGEGWGDLL